MNCESTDSRHLLRSALEKINDVIDFYRVAWGSLHLLTGHFKLEVGKEDFNQNSNKCRNSGPALTFPLKTRKEVITIILLFWFLASNHH